MLPCRALNASLKQVETVAATDYIQLCLNDPYTNLREAAAAFKMLKLGCEKQQS